jgi:hypothetical protein
MATIFPGSASVGQIFDGYEFNGTAWDIVGIDLTADYLESSTASSTYLTQTSASTIYQIKVENVDNTEIGYLNNASANIQTQLNSKANLSGATFAGNITAPEFRASTKLVAQTVGGDEGGEILLGKAATNTTLSGDGVTIDVWQNRLRIFEQGGDARGGYIDVSKLGNGVSTNLTPGMVLVKTQTVGSGVTSVVVNDAFSAAYDNYEILWTGGTMASSSGDSQIYLSLNGGTGSDYTTYLRYTNGTTMNVAAQTTTRFMWIGGGSPGSGLMQIKLYAPYLSVHTRSESGAYNSWNNGFFGTSNGVHTVSSSYTGFTATVSGTGTMSNGTIRVYGYNNG